MSRPDAVTDLATTGDLRTITVGWEPLPWSTVVDHYRVYGVPGDDRGALTEPREQDLLVKTVYPQWTHRGLSTEGERWTYAVVTVDAAGHRSAPSATVVGDSTASIIHGGAPLATVGAFDSRTLEFLYAPSDYAAIPEAYPDAVIDVTGGPDAAEAWPYLLPGPGDAWAGNQAYVLNWALQLEEVPTRPAMAIWLVDTTRLGGTLEIAINGRSAAERTLIAGGTRGSREGDATVPGTDLVPSYHEFELPADVLQPGANTVRFTLAEGGWVAWDAVGLYAL
jgi:hypothetical protein